MTVEQMRRLEEWETMKEYLLDEDIYVGSGGELRWSDCGVPLAPASAKARELTARKMEDQR